MFVLASFLQRFTSTTPLSQIWGLVRRLSGNRRPSPLSPLSINNTLISEPQAIVDAIADSISHCSSSANYRPGFIDSARINFRVPPFSFDSDNTEEYNLPFTLSELQRAIATAGDTSVGPDKLHYSFFRHLPHATLLFILDTFNSLWSQHVFPEAWREAIIIPIPKTGKDVRDPYNYRPIALTSCMGKLLERMVVQRLSWHLERHHLLSDYQCGFRGGRSTVDHIVRLETDVRVSFKRHGHTTAVFLDVSRAYDMVFKPALIFKLHQMGIRGHLAHYLVGFLSGTRSFQVRCRSALSAPHQLQNGLPQGSCISPVLFNIMIDDLFHDIPHGVSFSLYADDSAIWCSDRNYEHTLVRLQRALNCVERWAIRYGFRFSAPKSAVMIFSKMNTNPLPNENLQLSGHTIPFVRSFKFLGVVLDPRLSFRKHTEHIRIKCLKRLNLFRCLTSSPIGADRVTLLRLYRTLVLPIIEYGSVVYAGASALTLGKLDVQQNAFLRVALGAMRTSPVASLQIDAGVPALHVRRVEQTLRYAARVRFRANHPSQRSLDILPRIHHNRVGPSEKRTGLTIASRITTFSDELDFYLPQIAPMPVLTIAPWKLPSVQLSFLFRELKSNITVAEAQQRFHQLQAEMPNSYLIFTDGSKMGERTGNAVCDIQNQIQHRLPDGTSVFVAELHAIYMALKIVRRSRSPDSVICSDSKSALQSIVSFPFSHQLHFRIRNLHTTLCHAGYNIVFLWVPSHCGIQGNELADYYAKRSLTLDVITPVPCNLDAIKSALRQRVRAHWQTQWQTNAPMTQIRNIKPVTEAWSSSSRKNRHEEKVLCRLRIGHTFLTHSYIFTQNPRPRCVTCDETITVPHLLLRCPKYQLHRRILQHYCQTHDTDFSLSTVLGDQYPDLINLLFDFLRGTNLFQKL